MDAKQSEISRHIRTLLDDHKREVYMLSAELKLKLPTYIKTLTINELRKAGGLVEPNISLPRTTEERLRGHADSIRKKADIKDKFQEIQDQYRSLVQTYYRNVKRRLSDKLLNKRLKDLSDEEWDQLSIDSNIIKKQSNGN